MTESPNPAVWETLLEFRWKLDATMERLGWDQPPMLYTVHSMEGQEATLVAVAPIEIWPLVLQQAPTFQAALHMTRVIHQGARIPADPTSQVLGVMLVHEAWMLRDPDAIAAGQQPSTSDLRVEIRLTYLAAPDGRYAILSHERDGIAQDWEGAASGAVPQLLTELAQAYAP